MYDILGDFNLSIFISLNLLLVGLKMNNQFLSCSYLQIANLANQILFLEMNFHMLSQIDFLARLLITTL